VGVAQPDREFASVGRRLGAACIDVTCVLVAMAGVMGGRLLWDKRRPGDVFKDLEDLLERWNRFTETPRWRRAGPVLSVVGTVGLRNWRSPGLRVMGIHREDVRTGGPVTMRSVLTRELAGRARGRLMRRLTGPRFERHQAQVQALQGDVEAARRKHPDDKVAQQQAIMQVYRDAGVNPASCCWWPLAGITLDVVVVLATPRHQSVADWIAGIVFVRD
jgi:hypothetical protein